MGRNFKISMVIVGTVIGAGFASGKEICTFFLRFGDAAYGLAVTAGLLFFGGFYIVMSVGAGVSERGVDAFNLKIFGKFGGVGIVILLLSNLLVTSSMLGAFDLVIPCDAFPVGGMIAAFAAFCVLSFGLKGLIRVNSVAVPLLIVMTVVIAVYGVFESGAAFTVESARGGTLQAFLYVGMNMLTLGGTLSEFRIEKKGRLAISALAASVITGLIVLEMFAIRSCGTQMYNADMPMLAIAESVKLGIPMRIVLALGIFTSLTSAVHVNAQWLMGILPSRAINLAAVLLVGWVVSRFGFGYIVEKLYPVLGLAGLVVMSACLVAWIRFEWARYRTKFAAKFKKFGYKQT